jgi:hypothetical protein
MTLGGKVRWRDRLQSTGAQPQMIMSAWRLSLSLKFDCKYFPFKFGCSPDAMPPTRFEPSSIKNRIKREDVHRSAKKSKSQAKLKRRLALKEAERKDPSLKQVSM